MKYSKWFAGVLAALLMLTACSAENSGENRNPPSDADQAAAGETVEIILSDSGITVDGEAAPSAADNRVYVGNDIIYYEAGKDFTYGEGSEADAHSSAGAAEHTVVHITQPGTYSIAGSLSKGQIAVDLGEQAKEDPEAVVTLLLKGVDIRCQVAPAIIFYNVYECGSADADQASKDVDTSSAGANVILADGSENTVSGSYVARIYRPDSVVLNDAGTEVEDAKKLHKYDAAFYSRMSMNVSGEAENSGVLIINAENEGLDSELHLTINGGIIWIYSGNDGINTNEDGVSVTTVNGGEVHIRVTGQTGEGDGIDSNGWLVINGGTVTAQACASSADAGIDSDMGIHINGGTVMASGNMLDRISGSDQTYAVFNFSSFPGAGTYCLKNAAGEVIFEQKIENSFTSLILSGAQLKAGDYTLWYNDAQLVGIGGENGGMRPNMGERPEGMMPPEMQDGERPEMPEGFAPGKERPSGDGTMPPAGFGDGAMDMERPESPDGIEPAGGRWPGSAGGFGGNTSGEASEIFTIREGANYFSNIDVKN